MTPPIRRRQFLLGAASTALAGPARAAGRPDAIVIGAGAFGGWTALHLREAGLSVELLDAYGPGNARSASGGESRLVRSREADADLFRLQQRSIAIWKERQERWGVELLAPTGYLALDGSSDSSQWIADSLPLLREAGVAFEILKPDEIAKRWPAFRVDDVGSAYYEPDGATGRARASCLSVAKAFRDAGGTFRIARARLGAKEGRRLLDVRLGDGERIAAGTFVFACGPWLGSTLPEAMGPRLRTPRREVFFVGPPPGDPRFRHPGMPAWADRTPLGNRQAYYGFPDIEGYGFRVTPANDENALDPDHDDRVVSAWQLRRLYGYVGKRFPDLAGQPVVHTQVCQTEYTPDRQYIVDRHPGYDNVWIVGGGSGHGFKCGPGVGEFAASRILGREADPAWTRRFAWREDKFEE